MFLLYEYDIFWAFLIIASAIPILAFLISRILALIHKGPEKLSSYESLDQKKEYVREIQGLPIQFNDTFIIIIIIITLN